MPSVLRVIADGLVARAENRPKDSESAGMLRDAAASLLDADQAIERENMAASVKDAPHQS